MQILWVHPSYQGKGIEAALLNACVSLAISLELPAVAGIFTSGACQARAESLGFEKHAEIPYSRWIVNDRVIFDDPGRGNYSAAFMGKLVQGFEGEVEGEDDQREEAAEMSRSGFELVDE